MLFTIKPDNGRPGRPCHVSTGDLIPLFGVALTMVLRRKRVGVRHRIHSPEGAAYFIRKIKGRE